MFPKFPDRKPSAVRLREKLAARDGRAGRMYQAEALYHTQVEWTCKLLGVVDEVTDPAAAERITDAIYERLAGDGVSEAAERAWKARAEIEQLMASAPAVRLEQLRYTRDHGGLMSPDAKAELRELEGPGSV